MLTKIEKFVDQVMARLPRKKPGAADLKKAWIIAHRGAHDNASACRENTLLAFDKAFSLGCDGIEFDVHATADHQLVINHDPDLKRLWGVDKKIAELNFKEIRALVPAIPLLSEVVERYGKKMHLFIELKAPFTEEKALEKVLSPLEAIKDYHLISLHPAVFSEMQAFDRQSMYLIADIAQARKYCQLSLKEHYGGLMGHYLFISSGLLKKLREAGQGSGVGFVDSPNSLYRELNRGIYWLFSNKPEALCPLKAEQR